MARPPKISNEQIICLLVKYEFDQKTVAQKLGISQPALSSRLKRNPDIRDIVESILYTDKLTVRDALIKAVEAGEVKAIIAAAKIFSDKEKKELETKQKQNDLIQPSDRFNLKINRIPVFPGHIPEIEPQEGVVNLLIPIALAGIWTPKRFFIAHSGRSAAKSFTFAGEAICRALEEKMLIACLRETQDSIKDSVHRLLVDRIIALGVEKYFKIQKKNIICKLTGSEFIFKGLFNLRAATSIKSLENAKLGWIEEAQSVAAESWEILEPTIRAPGSEIWCSINPTNASDIIYSEFIGKNAIIDHGTIVVKTSWRDNPWTNETIIASKDRCRKKSEAKYQHVWGGELKSLIGQMIKRDWWHFWDPTQKYDYMMKFISADTAFSDDEKADYSVLQVWAITSDLKHIDLIDSIRGQWTYPVLVEKSHMMIERHTGGQVPLGSILIEKKASGQSLLQSLSADLPNHHIMPFEPGVVDKVKRVYACENAIFDGSVRIPPEYYAPWVKPFVDEVCDFRDDMSHDYDDQVDAMTQAIITWIEETQ